MAYDVVPGLETVPEVLEGANEPVLNQFLRIITIVNTDVLKVEKSFGRKGTII
jgi:hypothetical protein